jgi:hypothetical protein
VAYKILLFESLGKILGDFGVVTQVEPLINQAVDEVEQLF